MSGEIYVCYGSHLEEILATAVAEELKDEKFLKEHNVHIHKWKNGYDRRALLTPEEWKEALELEDALVEKRGDLSVISPKIKLLERKMENAEHESDFKLILEQRELSETALFIIDLHTTVGICFPGQKRKKKPYLVLENPLKGIARFYSTIADFVQKLQKKKLIVKDDPINHLVNSNYWAIEIFLPSKELEKKRIFHANYHAADVKLWYRHLEEAISSCKKLVKELVIFLDNFYSQNLYVIRR